MNILSLEHISKSFIGGPVLSDVSLYIPEGARIGVIGVNWAFTYPYMTMDFSIFLPLVAK